MAKNKNIVNITDTENESSTKDLVVSVDTLQDVKVEKKEQINKIDLKTLFKSKIRKSVPKHTSSDIPKKISTGMLVSRLNNPVYISYGSTSILVPPRGKIKDLNPEMLGSLPKGLDFVIKD